MTNSLPCSHKSEKFPSGTFIDNHSVKVTAPAGSFIVLDCMVFHRGGFNNTESRRRAINHVFTIPYFRQQINIPNCISNSSNLSDYQKEILGFKYQALAGVKEFLNSRETSNTNS